MAALASEISRHDANTRDVLAKAIRTIVSVIADELPAARTRQEAEETARAIFGLMVGTLQIARITRRPAESEAILAAGREAALGLSRRLSG